MKVTHRLFDTEAAKVKREARMLRTLMKKLKEHFAPYLESALPRAFEKACERTRRRFRRAYIYIYIIHQGAAFKELKDEGVVLDGAVKGYTTFRPSPGGSGMVETR